MRNIKIFSTFLILLSISIEGLEVLEVKMLDSYYLTKQFPGKLLPVEQSKLSFEIPGKIKNIYVDVGDDVKEGQVLAKLDDRLSLIHISEPTRPY